MPTFFRSRSSPGRTFPTRRACRRTQTTTAHQVALSEDGSRIWFSLMNWLNSGGDPEYLVYTMLTGGTGDLQVAGTQRLAGSSRSRFLNARMSDDGRILAAPTSRGIYVQHDGAPPPSGFPSIASVSSGYDSTTDELVLEAIVAPDSSQLARIYTLPLYRGIEPARILPEEENPLSWEVYGGGVNWSTTFTRIGASDVWERRIPMQGKFGLLNSDFSIRVVAVDLSGHRTAYYDYVMTSIGDGFESGDLSAWSGSTR